MPTPRTRISPPQAERRVLEASSVDGFSLIELLVVIALLGILVSTAVLNYQSWRSRAFDTTAESDYRTLKLALAELAVRDDAPDTIIVRRLLGAANLPEPFARQSISENVDISIVYRKRLRRNRPPATRTRIDVQHLEGGKRFRFTEVNGIITEQVLQRN